MRINKLIKTKYKTKIKNIKTDSRKVFKHDLFICALGNIDKNDYINDAIKKGASFIICNRPIDYKIPYALVSNSNLVLKEILDKYYNNPLKKINLIGITGTDGKTTTSTILKDMTNTCCLGTNGFLINKKRFMEDNTTPSLDIIYYYLNYAILNKKKTFFMEVSSEAYLTKRIPYLSFNIGVLTNITKEHLDKHKTFKNYFNCKMQLLQNSNLVIINHDMRYFSKVKKVNSNYQTYGFKKSDITIKKYFLYIDHTDICFMYKKELYSIKSPLIGKYNVYNLMASVLVLLNLNYSMCDIITLINNIKPIIGRNEIIYKGNFKIMLDHAHTIEATKEILSFLRKCTNNRLITILGCAGGRYQEKRSIIGYLAMKYSDIVIYTEDDPRDENVLDIIHDMLDFKRKKKEYYIIPNREKAIEKAISIVKKDDLIIILGRGRDSLMHIKDKDIIFNDYEEVIKILKKYKYL